MWIREGFTFFERQYLAEGAMESAGFSFAYLEITVISKGFK